MPVEQCLQWYLTHSADLEKVPLALTFHAVVHAMVGQFERARELMRVAAARSEELGQRLLLAGIGMQGTDVEMLAGDHEAAARAGIDCCAALQELGERGWLSTAAGQAGQALLAVGRDDEAERWIEVADEVGGADDVITQALIRLVRAKLASRRGRPGDAEALARDAVALLDATDMLETRADAWIDLAAVLRAAGRDDEVRAAVEEAATLYERKGHLVGLARARALLASATDAKRAP